MMTRLLNIGVVLTFLLSTTAVIQADDYVGKVRAEKILVTSIAGNGQQHTYLRTDKPEVTALTVDFPPGSETGWHLHTVPVYAYVVSGTLTVELADGKELVFKQGEAIVEVQNLAHNGKNLGKDTVRLAVFYTGEKGRPNVTRVAKPATAP